MAESGTLVLDQPKIRTLQSARLELRTLQMSDLDGVMPIITRTEIMQWTSQGPMQNRDQGERWLSARALGPDVFNFAIRERSGNMTETTLVGLVGSFHRPEVGYMIHPDFAGKGYATEALNRFIPAFFDHVPAVEDGTVGHNYVEAITLSNNAASQRVLEKAGFVRCGTYPEEGHVNVVFRQSRPGMALDQIDAGPESLNQAIESPPEPPIQ